jgi:2-keto-3-deoxy-L-fuconate dehydrogenase
MGRLSGKRALVTGSGQGIGRAVVIAYAKEGASVVAVSRTASKLADLPAMSSAIEILTLDVTDGDAVEQAISQAGKLDILFNCAGWVHHGTIADCSRQDWLRSLDQNVTSCFHTIRAALPQMLSRGSGSIINVASVVSSIAGVPNRVAYGASKAALIGLTKAVARDVVAQGVRVNALCPGTTWSPSLEDRISGQADPARARAEFIARQPMGRFGTAEEMAAVAVYLGSDESAFTTGQTIVVDGGLTL